jgi:copper resistance protein B
VTTRRFARLTAVAAGVVLLLAGSARAQSPSATAATQDPHAAHGHRADQSAAGVTPAQDAQHSHDNNGKPARDLPPFIPPITDEDRQAAFPDLKGHAAHDQAVNYFVLFDQLEWQGASESGINLDAKGWVGMDRDRLWFRVEGDSEGGRVREAQTHILYGRQVSRWWDVVGGIRQDVRPGSAQTWAAVGVQGLAPYWFEVEATAYVGASGRTHARFEVEYELLLTNRLIVQPLIEAEIVGKSDPERGVGSGLSMTDAGFRLRYEFRREVAPYVGVVWSHKWGKTADFAEAAGDDTGGARFVAGLRLWF